MILLLSFPSEISHREIAVDSSTTILGSSFFKSFIQTKVIVVHRTMILKGVYRLQCCDAVISEPNPHVACLLFFFFFPTCFLIFSAKPTLDV